MATFGPSKDFPAFFVPKSGFLSPYNVESAIDAAKMISKYISVKRTDHRVLKL